MNTQIIFLVIIAFVGFLIYDQYSKKDKIYCGFIRKDKTLIWKWVKKGGDRGRVDFDGGWYYIDPDCIIGKWHYIGYYNSLLFRWDSNQPIDPKTGEPKSLNDDPVARKNLDKKEDIMAYNQAQQQVAGKIKMGMLQQYLPIIMIIGFLIVGYFVFTLKGNVDALGAGQNAIEGMLDAIMNK